MSSQPNKNTALATNHKAIQGVDKHFVKVKNVTIAGVSYTPAALKAVLQAEIDANTALDSGRAQFTEQVASTRAARARASAARKGLRAYILGNYGAGAVSVLEDFGMSPPKPPGPRSAQAVADASVKAAATRKARLTVGRKKRLLIKAVPSQAAQAEAPAQVVQAPEPAPIAAPAAGNTPSHS